MQSNPQLSSGVVHDIPADVLQALTSKSDPCVAWQSLTPLARNEWLCWIEDAKKPETRSRRIQRTLNDLALGKRRPCCWMGCAHRPDKPPTFIRSRSSK